MQRIRNGAHKGKKRKQIKATMMRPHCRCNAWKMLARSQNQI